MTGESARTRRMLRVGLVVTGLMLLGILSRPHVDVAFAFAWLGASLLIAVGVALPSAPSEGQESDGEAS